ncbi:MAG: anion permease [Chlamydiae bacterium RIFCSPHIGHO2_12_FULL_44_59]|nr:MAG: anion permease [Chlamydiae bacterium RIFCSPHIGHO2_02_FULL_45_9]OGN56849.1 MAG: anion permease [Chlamydiae bacterium RIFCSPHIGHO2_01_FULL_44_39]OGN59507.1 MAG: anion permease [Chlamydiae bacterium RIFCSPHIGHO2_12_FULL_44_59]OGN67252.1 MAG: anion permease [Chlamydiae bacterium RIFCSPLOWO2_01_FULL_44_52]OGN68674.1 MAG: anion permease [Chlamydiae bacterium RIFCSPLOWO2_02_FULL_45_22]OGN69195.1 MAG: anion permease [Chlamydiae bacterium RIFCSPLOWO2_12_FULL_45_20]
MKNYSKLAFSLLIGLLLWYASPPVGMPQKGWNLFALFVATMVAVILRPFPMGVTAIFSLAIAVTTKLLTFDEAFSGFSNDVVWLIVFAFFVARGFILTGLGNRLAFTVMSFLGKNSLGLGYGLVATDLILAPAIPSVTARVGGIIYPMVRALADVFTGNSHDPKMGGFLAITAFQGSVVTSAMFLTAMAGNPLIAQLARNEGIEITWASWFVAALVPGVLSLTLIPYLLFRMIAPTIRKTPHAKEMAKERLKKMGPMKRDELIMLGTFVLLIVLWIIGPKIAMKATLAALIGVVILLLTGILKWRDLIEETGAWDTYIWFAVLVTLATFLNKFGVTQWFSQWVVTYVSSFPWISGFVLISLLYFYTHYFFASSVAHIGAMYAPLLIVSIALGTPPELAVLILAFFSNLYAGLTHYGSGAAPILFETGYLSVASWWKMGFIISLANIGIWFVFGGLWWKVLGYW